MTGGSTRRCEGTGVAVGGGVAVGTTVGATGVARGGAGVGVSWARSALSVIEPRRANPSTRAGLMSRREYNQVAASRLIALPYLADNQFAPEPAATASRTRSWAAP